MKRGNRILILALALSALTLAAESHFLVGHTQTLPAPVVDRVGFPMCHLTGGGLSLSAASRPIGAQWDYVFRPDLYFGGGSGAVPNGVLQHYVFVPSTIHARPGEIVTVYNSDQLLHRIVADDGSFDTGVMVPGASFTVKAGNPGSVISYHCVLHSRVKGQVVVDGAEHGRPPTPRQIVPIYPPSTEP